MKKRGTLYIKKFWGYSSIIEKKKVESMSYFHDNKNDGKSNNRRSLHFPTPQPYNEGVFSSKI